MNLPDFTAACPIPFAQYPHVLMAHGGGKRCTPEHPLGATMVSSEGACAAYYRYRRQPT